MIKQIKKLIYTLLAIIALSGIILIHELGHLSFAKLFKVPVSVFAIGFGPSLFETKINNTIYKIGLLPLGGYVKITQDQNQDFLTPETSSKLFKNKPYYQKILILLGGIIFNLISGFIFLIISLYLQKNKHKLQSLLLNFKNILKTNTNKSQVQGPIGILSFMSKGAEGSIALFLFMLAFLSFNLAIFNLIPIPLLDGGQVLIVIIEAILGYNLPDAILYFLNLISLILFTTFFVYISTQDIKSLYK